jgi:2-oxoglutarate dehydrogenase complex dehydrogenase (E1) component-like enzyme
MSIPVSSADVMHLLASYPHVASCPWCCEYADEYLEWHPATAVLVAVLDHHDSAHTSDRLGRLSAQF